MEKISVTTDIQAERLSILSEREHGHCIVCGSGNHQGLQLQFTVSPDGSVKSVFSCQKLFEGYDGMLHGGIASSLLDGAMTNCLFSKGIVATTGELVVRFLHPVAIDQKAVVRARVVKSHPPLHVVEADLLQGDEVQVRATGKFMEL